MAKEKRLIDRDALLAELDKFANPMPNKSGYDFLCGIATAITEIENAPTVDTVEVVHGRWVEKVDMVESYLSDCTEVFYECSVCASANIGESPYCPNCGAQMMDGGNENV